MTLPACFFAIPGNIDTLTGGYGYDRRILKGLRALGVDMQHLPLPDGFPLPDAAARTTTAALLSSLPDSSIVLIDGLAYGVLDAEIASQQQRLRFIALCHHPLALETGLAAADSARLHAQEQCALDMARAIVVTSHGTRDLLTAEFGQRAERITVALPGTDRQRFAECHGSPPLLLTVATLTRRKAHDVLIEALAGLRALPWQARFVGGGEFDAGWTAHLHALVTSHGLNERIHFAGSMQSLRDEYLHADIFVLPSRFEGYGMAFAEALSFGLPVVAARAGAVPDVVPPSAGLLVTPGSSSELQAALYSLLTDSVLRTRLQQGARTAAASLPTWEDAARQVHELIIEVSKQP